MLGRGRLDFAVGLVLACWPCDGWGVCCLSCLVPGCCGMGWACVPLVCLGWRCVGLFACVRVCVWIPGLPGLRDLLPPGKIPGFPQPGLAGPFRRPGGAGAGWIVGQACCRCRLSCVAAYVGGYACIVREGMPGALWRSLWACFLLWIVCRSAWETRKFYRKIPRKNAHEKIFQKKFPLWGNGLPTKIFCKKGVDKFTHE